MSVRELFSRLRDGPLGNAYTAAQIEGSDNVYLGVNLAGQPCLLARTESRFFGAPLRAAKVSFRPTQEFNVAISGNAPSRQMFSILSCESSDKVEIESFLILLEGFLASYAGSAITEENLTSFFRSMVRLFTVLRARDLDAERQGLWGELFVMRQVRGYTFWVPFWHSDATRTFDFSTPGMRVEVKTTTSSERIHHFSHRQIYSLAGEEIVIASLLIREEDAGLSLQTLIGECREALQGSIDYLKLESAVRRAGLDDRSIEGPKFDAAQAELGLGWFRSTDAPHFRMAEPPGVSETRYKVDLSTAPQLARNDLDKWLDIWGMDTLEQAVRER